MKDLELRPMTEADLAGADDLRRLAGWNQTPEDWRRLLRLEPEGCFVAVQNGAIVGTVTTTTYGQALAWIGMMLIHPDLRRQGLGTRLMRRSLEYLQSRGVGCIRLDATPAGRPVYEKLGFVAEWTLTRWQRPEGLVPVVVADTAPGIASPSPVGVVPFCSEDGWKEPSPRPSPVRREREERSSPGSLSCCRENEVHADSHRSGSPLPSDGRGVRGEGGGEDSGVRVPSSRSQSGVVSPTRNLHDSDWPAVERLDAAAFGVARLRLIRDYAQQSRAALVWPSEGDVAGWGLLRAGTRADYLGPLACREAEGSWTLATALLRQAGTNSVFWDVPDQNQAAQEAVQRLGFERLRPLTRMRLGPDIAASDPQAQWAIVDPAVG
jgi:ribosomal protein S18 acetylase RimI-like enzyme